MSCDVAPGATRLADGRAARSEQRKRQNSAHRNDGCNYGTTMQHGWVVSICSFHVYLQRKMVQERCMRAALSRHAAPKNNLSNHRPRSVTNPGEGDVARYEADYWYLGSGEIWLLADENRLKTRFLC